MPCAPRHRASEEWKSEKQQDKTEQSEVRDGSDRIRCFIQDRRGQSGAKNGKDKRG